MTPRPASRHQDRTPHVRATVSGHGVVAHIDETLLQQKIEASRVNPRLREIHSFHTGPSDPFQRMLNALQPGSYVRPHRHTGEDRSESFVVVRGSLALVLFSEAGLPLAAESRPIGAGFSTIGADIRSGVWHSFFALSADTVVFEAKPGPYVVDADKDFASWAPAEGDASASEWLARLEDRLRLDWRLEPRSWSREPSGTLRIDRPAKR